MSGTVSGLFFPACALFFSALLCIVYFSKERIKINENKLYSIMVFSILLDSFFALLLQIIANRGVTDIEIFGMIFNKLDFICLISYSMSMFIYSLFITYEKTSENYRQIMKYMEIIYLVTCIIVLVVPLDFLAHGEYKSIGGMSANITFGVCALLIFASFLIAIINIKKVSKKHLPILFVPVLIALVLFLYLIKIQVVFVTVC